MKTKFLILLAALTLSHGSLGNPALAETKEEWANPPKETTFKEFKLLKAIHVTTCDGLEVQKCSDDISRADWSKII